MKSKAVFLVALLALNVSAAVSACTSNNAKSNEDKVRTGCYYQKDVGIICPHPHNN